MFFDRDLSNQSIFPVHIKSKYKHVKIQTITKSRLKKTPHLNVQVWIKNEQSYREGKPQQLDRNIVFL